MMETTNLENLNDPKHQYAALLAAELDGGPECPSSPNGLHWFDQEDKMCIYCAEAEVEKSE